MDKVSVLVAVYNAATFLPKCLGSLLSQSHADIQVICVDDCSTDNSPAILDSYAAQDERVSVVHLASNHGQAYARNAGLAVANGQYVCMLDADDWFSPDALEEAVGVFRQHPLTDAVLFDTILEYGDRSERYAMPQFEALTGKEAFALSLTWKIHGLYMIRAELHKKIPYDTSYRTYSDDNTTRLHYLASREVRRCHGEYHYLQHGSSVTHAISGKRFDYLGANESLKNELVRLGVDQDLVAEYENQRWLNLVDVYMFYRCHAGKLRPDERRHGKAELRRAWHGIDRGALRSDIKRKFGYRPMPSWWMFRLQEWAYFSLRGLLGKNR